MPTIFITGGSGSIGVHAISALLRRGVEVRALCRNAPIATERSPLPQWVQGDILRPDGWKHCLAGVDAIVHLAGQSSERPEDTLYRTNVLATSELAKLAGEIGVKRFVFMSSVRVHGHASRISDTTPLEPADPYGRSKMLAEQHLREAAEAGGVDCVILRPPFVYGADRSWLFSLFARAARYHVPLPVPARSGRRSYIHVGNLADAVATVATAPSVGSMAVPVADGSDWTMRQLFGLVAASLGHRAIAIPVPTGPVRLAGSATGMRAMVDRMMEDRIVDGRRFSEMFDWRPPHAPEIAVGLALSNLGFRGGRV